jgi:hypothetical protein
MRLGSFKGEEFYPTAPRHANPQSPFATVDVPCAL